MIDYKYHALNGNVATVEIDEANGAEVLTHSIVDSDMGNQDSATIDPVAFPITAGNRTFIKYQKIHVTAMGGSSKIDNLKVWRTGVLGTGGVHSHYTNARTAAYGGALVFAAPVVTAVTGVDQAMPTAVPATANLGIAGALTGSLTAVGSSDYLGHQIGTDASATAGATTTMNYQYDETA